MKLQDFKKFIMAGVVVFASQGDGCTQGYVFKQWEEDEGTRYAVVQDIDDPEMTFSLEDFEEDEGFGPTRLTAEADYKSKHSGNMVVNREEVGLV